MTELKRELNNLDNTGDATLSRFKSAFLGVENAIRDTRDELVLA